MTRVELVLLNGAVRALELPASTSSLGNALTRLDDWIETSDGGWVNKAHVVEVRTAERGEARPATVEFEALDAAAETMIAGARENGDPTEPTGA